MAYLQLPAAKIDRAALGLTAFGEPIPLAQRSSFHHVIPAPERFLPVLALDLAQKVYLHLKLLFPICNQGY
jgi:hypothetical protein